MKRLLAALLLAAAAGCATGPRIDTSHTAVSQDSRAQFLILHFTTSNLPASLAVLTLGPVSSHYLVNDDPPTVYRLVDESRRAWHAGESSWQGHTQLNAASIGIEIVNAGNRLTPDGVEWADYPRAQIDAATQRVVAAFQMKYRPELHDGVPDAETAALLDMITSATAHAR